MVFKGVIDPKTKAFVRFLIEKKAMLPLRRFQKDAVFRVLLYIGV